MLAAALNLIANTAPAAWGAIGTPVHTLAAVTALPESDLNAMIGRILPITAIIVPFWLVRAMVGWKDNFEALPAIRGVGVSFAITQFLWANYVDSNLVDIASGVMGKMVDAQSIVVATSATNQVGNEGLIFRFAELRGIVGEESEHGDLLGSSSCGLRPCSRGVPAKSSELTHRDVRA